MGRYIEIKIPPKEFLEKFSIEFRAENNEIIEKFREILEKSEKVILSSHIPVEFLGFKIMEDIELDNVIEKIDLKYSQYIEEFVYNNMLELGLNKLIISIHKDVRVKYYIDYTEETKNILEIYEILKRYPNDILIYIQISNSLVEVLLSRKSDKMMLVVMEIGKYELPYNKLELIIKTNVLMDRLKDYLKALSI